MWPDTGRAERVEASIRLAQQDLPMVIAGRANAVLPGVLAGLPAGATAIVTTTWAFGYFSLEERAQFVELLRATSARRPIAWVSAEGGGTVDALVDVGAGDSSGPDVLGAMLLNGGADTMHLLGYVHGHGNWLDWRAPTCLNETTGETRRVGGCRISRRCAAPADPGLGGAPSRGRRGSASPVGGR